MSCCGILSSSAIQLVVNPGRPASLGSCHRCIDTYDTARLDVKRLVDADTGTSIYGFAGYVVWWYGEYDPRGGSTCPIARVIGKDPNGRSRNWRGVDMRG